MEVGADAPLNKFVVVAFPLVLRCCGLDLLSADRGCEGEEMVDTVSFVVVLLPAGLGGEGEWLCGEAALASGGWPCPLQVGACLGGVDCCVESSPPAGRGGEGRMRSNLCFPASLRWCDNVPLHRRAHPRRLRWPMRPSAKMVALCGAEMASFSTSIVEAFFGVPRWSSPLVSAKWFVPREVMAAGVRDSIPVEIPGLDRVLYLLPGSFVQFYGLVVIFLSAPGPACILHPPTVN